ncbi:hypothetical protein ABKN59_004247 [Abortiporus biennis]
MLRSSFSLLTYPRGCFLWCYSLRIGHQLVFYIPHTNSDPGIEIHIAVCLEPNHSLISLEITFLTACLAPFGASEMYSRNKSCNANLTCCKRVLFDNPPLLAVIENAYTVTV